MTREEQLACLTDRPCAVCSKHTEKGCSSWTCVFEEKPEEKIVGYWIGSDGSYTCSRCGNNPLNYIATMGAVDDAYMDILMDFCPCCGAHMIEKKVTE